LVQNEKGTSAYMTVDVSSDLGDAEQVRVEQLKENRHFLCIFHKNPRFAVLRGKRQDYNAQATALFRIVGDTQEMARPIEVTASSRSLHSRHAFVLRTPTNIFVWRGNFAADEAFAFANKYAEAIAHERPIQVLQESAIDNHHVFWKALNGKETYYHISRSVATSFRAPRMFHVSGATGTIVVEECHQFVQADLDVNHIVLLDCFNRFYVWFGPRSTVAEKRLAMQVALV
jgi:hypothetical protein